MKAFTMITCASLKPVAIPLILAASTLTACQPGSSSDLVPGDGEDTRPFSAIAPDEKLNFAATEPFWGGHVQGDMLIWKTPEKPAGLAIRVERFAGRGGLSYTGELEQKDFTLAFTPGTCRDGMSDRTYPLVVTVATDDRVLTGCGWRDTDDLGPPP